MAKNYTFTEAVEIIAKGKDLEAIADLGRRYPVLVQKVAVVATKAGEAFVDLMGYMPDYLTANKVNTAIKSGIAESGSNEDEGEIDEATTETEEVVEGEAVDYESMSGKQLWDLLGKAGKRKLAKSTKKADLVEACKIAFGANADEADEAEEEVEEDATEANPYEGKSAMELFKECKKRGIKAASKKATKYYIELLVADDAKSDDTEEAEDEDWGDEEETEAPKKKEVKPAKKAEKKPAKKAKTEDEDEDDDWDI